MISTKPLSLVAIAGAAWLNGLPATAAEEQHAEESRKTLPAASGNSLKTAPPVGSSSAPASPRTPEHRGGSGSDNRPSAGGSILMDLLFGSSDTSTRPAYNAVPSSGPKQAQDMYTQLATRGFASYLGLGVGKSMAYYPSNSDSDLQYHIYLGVRTRYIGAELGYNNLGLMRPHIPQPVDARTDAFSFSVLGFLPAGANADFFARYGENRWSVQTNLDPTGNIPPESGFDRVTGVGFEYRDGENFLRIEKEIFRHVYQSNYYSYIGISIGAYIK